MSVAQPDTFDAGYAAHHEEHCRGGLSVTLNDYQEDAMRTAGAALKESDGLILSALGMTGESGEYAELVKKHVYHGHEFDRDRAAKEIGDVLWYVARAATAIGIPLGEIADRNIAKLIARYPEGFSKERSIKRAESA